MVFSFNGNRTELRGFMVSHLTHHSLPKIAVNFKFDLPARKKQMKLDQVPITIATGKVLVVRISHSPLSSLPGCKANASQTQFLLITKEAKMGHYSLL